LKAWPALAIFILQALLLLAHWFVYSTCIAFWPGLSPAAVADLRATMLVLAFSFVPTSLLAFRFHNFAVRFLYWIAAIWLGFLNYLFWASCLIRLCWLMFSLVPLSADLPGIRPLFAAVLYASAALTGLYGLVNLQIIRIRRIGIRLPNLPVSWRGRRAVLLSDLHLGSINGVRFCRRMTVLAASFNPDIVFLPGDIYDGTKGDLDLLIAPLKQLAPPYGIYFSTGNHEEFHNTTQYLDAVRRAGIRVLANELVNVDGLQVAGVLYRDSSSPLHMKAAIDDLRLDRAGTSILLNHAPTRLPIVEQAGFSLQVSGHTHGGQLFPFTWLTSRIYGRFTYGLQRFGALQVYTSTGCGSWGPPMRVGTRPEIVVMEFE
jgi:predicted MPP superfamily phosphohydrolase